MGPFSGILDAALAHAEAIVHRLGTAARTRARDYAYDFGLARDIVQVAGSGATLWLLHARKRAALPMSAAVAATVAGLSWASAVRDPAPLSADEDERPGSIEDARAQFAQYGMTQVPDEYLENYADDMLKKKENVNAYVDRAVDVALMSALKNAVHLDEKEVTLDEFRALN